MKELLAVISLIVGVVVAEPPAPYPASGWRPSGPSFELPQRVQSTQGQRYLPPLDPRNPNTPNVEYDIPEEDVSVQGLPEQEEVQYFQSSPISGQQTAGAGFKSDIRNLNQGYQQSQYQLQQQTYREFDRQRQIDAQNNRNRLPKVQPPASFARTTPAPTEPTTPTTEAITTELNLNERETLDIPNNSKTTVEVSRQKVQEIPGEFFLRSLAQLQLQPQFVPLQQFGQIRAPILLQPGQSQKQVAGYDGQTHFAALPSVLAQQKLQEQQISQNIQSSPLLTAERVQQPAVQYQPINYQPQLQLQQDPAYVQPLPQYQPINSYQQPQLQSEPIIQPQTVYAQPNTAQPLPQYSVNFQPQQFPAQPVIVQPQAVNQLQPGQPKPNNPDAETIDNQYQPQLYQQPFLVPQSVEGQFQPQSVNQFQGQFQPQPALIQAQPIRYPNLEFYQKQQQGQSPDALQSGLDLNQQGNDIEEPTDEDTEAQDEGNKATAVATAFGARTQPRVFTQYGAPFPAPKVQAGPGYTTTESPAEEVTEDLPVVAQAVAVADATRRKNSRLRSRRVRPLFTLDRSGHLVLAQGQ